MGISGTAYTTLIQSTINRYLSNGMTPAEEAAILAATGSSGVLTNFINTTINNPANSAGPPTPNSIPIFYTGSDAIGDVPYKSLTHKSPWQRICGTRTTYGSGSKVLSLINQPVRVKVVIDDHDSSDEIFGATFRISPDNSSGRVKLLADAA